jgi:hypothetical protein
MVRPSATGLATAFYRLYLLESLASTTARPATLLAAIATERLPLASGAFGRALQSLLEGGHLVPAPEAAVALTPLGAAERLSERERWRAVIPTILRLIAEPEPGPRPAPIVAEAPAVAYRTAAVAESYLDRVLVTALRECVANARDGGRAFTLVLGVTDIDASSEATRRAIVHRSIRATLGGASTLFGGDTSAFRYGDSGVALVAPIVGDDGRGSRIATLLRARLDELLRTMSASVRAFSGSRWRIRVGHSTWSPDLVSSGALLRTAQEALARDGAVSSRPAA